MAMFMQWPEVEGGAQDVKHKGWITCESVTGGVTKALAALGAGATITQRNVDTVKFDPLKVTVMRDKATATLFKECVNGIASDEVKIEYVRQGGEVYKTLKMKDCLISAMSGVPKDKQDLKISYSAICEVSWKQDAKGKLTEGKKWGYNLLTDMPEVW